MARPRVKTGDVFRIPIDDTRCAYGQVFLKNHTISQLYVGIYRPGLAAETTPDLDEICSSEIALVGGTTDARIYHGMWTIVGNRPPDLSRLPRPNFKVEAGGRTIVEDFDGRFIREATTADVQKYDNRWSRSPMAFELAMQALHGIGTWTSDYDRLTLQHALEQGT